MGSNRLYRCQDISQAVLVGSGVGEILSYFFLYVCRLTTWIYCMSCILFNPMSLKQTLFQSIFGMKLSNTSILVKTISICEQFGHMAGDSVCTCIRFSNFPFILLTRKIFYCLYDYYYATPTNFNLLTEFTCVQFRGWSGIGWGRNNFYHWSIFFVQNSA